MPNLSMQMIPRPDLGLELLTLEEISAVMERANPFRDQEFVKEKEVIKYLENANGYLASRRNKTLEELRDYYLVSVGLYSFAKPLLQLRIEERLEENFISILRRGPYNLTQPLDLYFHSTEEELPVESIPDVLEITDQTLPVRAKFKKSKNFQQKIEQGLFFTIEDLEKEYSRKAHFSFVGYHDICVPLFNGSRQDAYFEIEDNLRLNQGVFLMKMPDYFKEEI